jgi:hypothetical protein
VCFSLSGGSGSIIGPLLIKEILRAGKVAIVTVVADMLSNLDAINTINTLKTLENVAGNNYLPMMLFSNEFTRAVVDSGITAILDKLINNICIANTRELDAKDKIHFFNPSKIVSAIEPGIKLLNVSLADNGDWAHDAGLVVSEDIDKVDAAMIISPQGEIELTDIMAHVVYYGVNEGNTALASIGYPIPPEFITAINNVIHRFSKTSENSPTRITIEHETDAHDDLVL